MTPIEQFNKIFDDKQVNSMISMVDSRLNTGCKKNNALDLIAVGNGYKDYKTAKGLWDKHNARFERTWCKLDEYNELNDENYFIFDSMTIQEKEKFLSENKDKAIVEINYCHDSNYGKDYPSLPDGCLTKDEIINIFKKHEIIYFEYEVRDCNGNPCFTYLVNQNDDHLVKVITSEVYQSSIEQCEKDFGFTELEECGTVESYVKWLKSKNKW